MPLICLDFWRSRWITPHNALGSGHVKNTNWANIRVVMHQGSNPTRLPECLIARHMAVPNAIMRRSAKSTSATTRPRGANACSNLQPVTSASKVPPTRFSKITHEGAAAVVGKDM